MTLLTSIKYVFKARGSVDAAKATAVAQSASKGPPELLAVHHSCADKSRMFHLASASKLIVCCRVCSPEQQSKTSVFQMLKDCVKDLLLLLLCCFL